MRATVLRDRQMIVRDDVPEPEPTPGQVVARVLACGICGSDLHFAQHAAEMQQVTGEMGGMRWRPPPADLTGDIFMGHEFAAEIVETASGVDGFAAGDVVTSMPVVMGATGPMQIGFHDRVLAGYGERIVLSGDLLQRVPNGLDPRHAALTEPMAVGVHAVNRSAIDAGGGAIVLGCGPVGLAVIAALQLRNVEHIIATDFSSARRALAEKMGATVVLEPSAHSPFEHWLSTAGTEAPVVFEAIGVPGMIDGIMRDAPPQSRVVVVGVCMQHDPITPLWAIAKELNLQFVLAYEPDEFSGTLRSIAEGELDVSPMISGEVGLDGVAGAFDDLANPDDHCKILVTPH